MILPPSAQKLRPLSSPALAPWGLCSLTIVPSGLSLCWGNVLGCDCLGNVFLNPFPAVGLLSRDSHVRLCVTLWAVANQAPLSMGLSRQEHWSGLPLPAPKGP